MLYSQDGTNVEYMNILGQGNSVTNRYNIMSSQALDYNPFGNCSISDMVSWNTSITNYLQGGDKNNMLVISYNTQAELEGS